MLTQIPRDTRAPTPDGVNIALFDKIAAQIESEPESYDQMVWTGAVRGDSDVRGVSEVCNTTFCIAGWALALIEGRQYVAVGSSLWWYDPVNESLQPASWRHAAMRALGIPDDEARKLFDPWVVKVDTTSVAILLRAYARGLVDIDTFMAMVTDTPIRD